MLSAFFIRVLNPAKDGFAESEELRPILQSVSAEFDLVLKDASDYASLGKISDQVTEAIQSADVIFADANSTNENVWYEIGYADRTNAKKVVCLYKRDRRLPFDRTDMRSVPYDDTDIGFTNLGSQLNKMMVDLLCDKRLRDIFMQSDWLQSITQYLSSTRLRSFGVDWLVVQARNTHENDRLRTRSLSALAAVGAVTSDLLNELLDRRQTPVVRAAAYVAASEFRGQISDELWNPSPDLENDKDLREAYAKGLVKQWLAGRLSESRFRELIVNNPGITSNVISAMQQSFESKPTSPFTPEVPDQTPPTADDIHLRQDRRHF